MEKTDSKSINDLCQKKSQTQIGNCSRFLQHSHINRESKTGLYVLVNNEDQFAKTSLNESSKTVNVSLSTSQVTCTNCSSINSDSNSIITVIDTTASSISSNHEDDQSEDIESATTIAVDPATTSGGSVVTVFSPETSKAIRFIGEKCVFKELNPALIQRYLLEYYSPLQMVSSIYKQNKQDDPKVVININSDLEIGSQSWINVCRICYGTGSFEELIGPCRCRGSVAFAHQSCLERWLRESSRSCCELCKFRYHIIRTPRYSMAKGILIWLFVPAEHTKELFSDILGFCLYTPAALVATYLLLASCESVRHLLLIRKSFIANLMAFIAISGMASIDFAYSTWLILRIKRHLESWQRWWSNNCHLTLIIPTDNETLADLLRKSVDTIIINPMNY